MIKALVGSLVTHTSRFSHTATAAGAAVAAAAATADTVGTRPVTAVPVTAVPVTGVPVTATVSKHLPIKIFNHFIKYTHCAHVQGTSAIFR